MTITNSIKQLAAMIMVLGLAVGCASTPEPEAPDESQRLAQEAINSAQSAIEEAAALGAEWREAQGVLDEAQAAFDAGDYSQALDLANQAETMARDAIAAYKAAQAAAAEDTTKSYEVMSGDNLWNIAGSSSIYGDPYRWPLIYKANKSKIEDADLIYPGQVFEVEMEPSADAVNAAVNHAKTRGAWSLGSVESSDRAYLAQ